MYDPHLIVEGQADLGTSGDTEIQAGRGGAIFVNSTACSVRPFDSCPATKGPIMDPGYFHHDFA